jgi:hypothetical protein
MDLYKYECLLIVNGIEARNCSTYYRADSIKVELLNRNFVLFYCHKIKIIGQKSKICTVIVYYSYLIFQVLIPEVWKMYVWNLASKFRNFSAYPGIVGDRGSTVVKVLRYKSEGRWLDPRRCHGIFYWHKYFLSQCGPGVDSASNRNEYQVYFLGVNAAGA